MSATTLAVQHCDAREQVLNIGDHVAVESGLLKGLDGTLTDHRADGRALIALARGAYVELPCCQLARCN